MTQALREFRLCWSVCLWWSVSLAAGSLPVAAIAQEGDLSSRLQPVAKTLKKFLAAEGHDSVAVGQFIGPPTAAGGRGIALALKAALEAHQVRVRFGAVLTIEGQYLFTPGTEGQRAATRVDLKVVDQQRKVYTQFSQFVEQGVEVRTEDNRRTGEVSVYVTRTEEVLALIGPTAALDPEKPRVERDQQLAAALQNPTAHLTAQTLRAAPGNPYGIEIWVKGPQDYAPRTIELRDGYAFAPLNLSELYAIRIINDSPLDAAVTITVDGLNLFAFSENRNYRHLVLSAGKRSLIKGWHRTNQTTDAFQISTYAQSAAAELQQDGPQIGAITVAFAACWPKDQPVPADEFAFRAKGTRGGANLATARGPAIEQNYREIDRAVGVVRSVITVRYDK